MSECRYTRYTYFVLNFQMTVHIEHRQIVKGEGGGHAREKDKIKQKRRRRRRKREGRRWKTKKHRRGQPREK